MEYFGSEVLLVCSICFVFVKEKQNRTLCHLLDQSASAETHMGVCTVPWVCRLQLAAWTELGCNLELKLILSVRGCFLWVVFCLCLRTLKICLLAL